MRIVWLSHTAGLGGAELSFVEAAKALVARGHEIHAIVPCHGKLIPLLEGINVSVSVVALPWWMHYTVPTRDPVRAFYRQVERSVCQVVDYSPLVRHVASRGADVVVTNTVTIPTGALAANQLGIPHVWYIHEFGFEDHRLKFDYGSPLSYTFMSRLSDAVIVNSQAVYAKYQRHLPSTKLHLVYYAVECHEGAPTPILGRGPLKLILVGQLHAGKKQEDAIRALALLRARGAEVVLTLLGGDAIGYGSYLRALASHLGVEDEVSIPGFNASPSLEIAASDVLLMCSESEAFGRVTVEAMKGGKPVIATTSGATPELVRDGSNGLLYMAGDVADLAKKIAILDANRDLLIEMGRRGKAWATETFTMSNYARDLLAVLEPLAAKRVRRTPWVTEGVI